MDRNETVIRARSDGEIEPGDDSPQFVFNLQLCIRDAISRTTEPISTSAKRYATTRGDASGVDEFRHFEIDVLLDVLVAS